MVMLELQPDACHATPDIMKLALSCKEMHAVLHAYEEHLYYTYASAESLVKQLPGERIYSTTVLKAFISKTPTAKLNLAFFKNGGHYLYQGHGLKVRIPTMPHIIKGLRVSNDGPYRAYNISELEENPRIEYFNIDGADWTNEPSIGGDKLHVLEIGGDGMGDVSIYRKDATKLEGTIVPEIWPPGCANLNRVVITVSPLHE